MSDDNRRKDSENAEKHRPIYLTIATTIGIALMYGIKILIEISGKGKKA